MSPHYVGPLGQQNDPLWEPVPDCIGMTIPVQKNPVTSVLSPGIPGVTIGLFDATCLVPLLPPVVTDANGKFTFGPFHFGRPAGLTVCLKELDVPPIPSPCNPNALAPVPPADLPAPFPWPGVFECALTDAHEGLDYGRSVRAYPAPGRTTARQMEPRSK